MDNKKIEYTYTLHANFDNFQSKSSAKLDELIKTAEEYAMEFNREAENIFGDGSTCTMVQMHPTNSRFFKDGKVKGTHIMVLFHDYYLHNGIYIIRYKQNSNGIIK